MVLFAELIIAIVRRLNISPSPTPRVILNRYEKSLFPDFDQLFETPFPSSPMCHFAREPEEASVAIVFENRSEKPITAWRYQWQIIDVSGRRRTHTASGDSYAVDVFRPVAEPESCFLITPSGSINQTTLKHVLAGGGFIGSGSRAKHSLDDVVELTFEIHLILFADGEIAGPDPDHFAAELQGRKAAAEFVAKQIRLARAEGRDVVPVLTALAEAPSLGGFGSAQGDPLFHSVREYARDYLRHVHRKIGDLDMGEARLRHLENRPTLPKFYRRLPPSE
jgi:hypothetical protein